MELLKIVEIDEKKFSETKAITVGENIFCVTTTELKPTDEAKEKDLDKESK